MVAYSSYEVGVITRLAQSYPQYEDRLLDLCGRVIDLLQLIRGNYYHPGFHGSFSLKSVVPTLIPELAYDDLDIPEGLTAAAAYAGLVAGNAPDSDQTGHQGGALSRTVQETRRPWYASMRHWRLSSYCKSLLLAVSRALELSLNITPSGRSAPCVTRVDGCLSFRNPVAPVHRVAVQPVQLQERNAVLQ